MISTELRPPSDATYTFDLSRLRFADAVTVGQQLRRCNAGASRQEDAARCVVEYLFDTFRDPETNAPNCALVRCFQTHPYADLPAGARGAARRALGGVEPAAGLRCLTLLATRGIEADWNQTETSVGHRVIPLRDAEAIEGMPMVGRLLQQMGLEPADIVGPKTELLMPTSQYRNFGVFHVETALGSVHIPSQQTFVEQYGIRSVVGMGGLLPSGEFFAVILFSRVVVLPEVAALFRTLALSVKLAFLPFASHQIFTDLVEPFV